MGPASRQSLSGSTTAFQKTIKPGPDSTPGVDATVPPTTGPAGTFGGAKVGTGPWPNTPITMVMERYMTKARASGSEAFAKTTVAL
jgi:hypothetical protein